MTTNHCLVPCFWCSFESIDNIALPNRDHQRQAVGELLTLYISNEEEQSALYRLQKGNLERCWQVK